MKKSLVALAVAGFAVAANAAPQANSFYVGAKAGWASFHDGLTQFDNRLDYYGNGENNFGVNKNSVTYGVFGGYQILDNLAVEAGYDYYGRARGNAKLGGDYNKTAIKHTAHGANISLKASYPIIADLDAYARAGVALVRNDYYVQNSVAKEDRTKYHRFQTSLLLGAGVEYAITPALAARVEYQWLNNVGNVKNTSSVTRTDSNYRPDVGSVNVGFTYRFGQAAPVVEPASEVITKNFTFDSDVAFEFGKADLKQAAEQELDKVSAEILGLATPSVQVSGYTDRIGKDAPNLKLSQRRAETVAKYMVSKGVDAANITAVGYGKANPKTGNTCDAVKGRKALIACLAPDRRVEVAIQGTKQVTM